MYERQAKQNKKVDRSLVLPNTVPQYSTSSIIRTSSTTGT